MKVKLMLRQNQRDLAKIRQDLARSGDVSLDLEPLRGGERFGGRARRDLPSPAVEIHISGFFL